MTDTKKSPETPDPAAPQKNQRIGDQLRRLYDEVASEPIPDEFLQLLENADEISDEDPSGEETA